MSIRVPTILLFGLAGLAISFTGCDNQRGPSNPVHDSPTSGTIHISVDETYRPVIEEQIKVYEATNPGTHIIASYKTEADCFRDLFHDTGTRMIVATRGLTDKEDRYFKDSLSYPLPWNNIASDAVAVVVNAKSTDTLFTLDQLKRILSGQAGKDHIVIFDGLNATSTVRFVTDSILRGKPFDTSVVKAARNSQGVLDYIASDERAIGLVGISWIGNPEDTAQVAMLRKVKLAYLRCDRCADSPYVRPSQSGIISHRYPLVRGLYYILKEDFVGLGSGFCGFLRYERGQLIFRRAYLGPVMDFSIRNVKM